MCGEGGGAYKALFFSHLELISLMGLTEIGRWFYNNTSMDENSSPIYRCKNVTSHSETLRGCKGSGDEYENIVELTTHR